MATELPYYRRDLALIHHLGFGFHADDCAPGVLALLEPVLARNGLVVEIGCGSGLLTRYLIDAGHRVIATDASPAMLDLAREVAGDALEIRRLTLPDDPIPAADAIVGVGHALNYLPDADAIDRALVAIAGALNPGGVLAIDLCDLEWGAVRKDQGSHGWVDDDWALVTEFSLPSPGPLRPADGHVHPRRRRLMAPRRRTPRQHPDRHLSGSCAPGRTRRRGDRAHVVRRRDPAGRPPRDRRKPGRMMR